VIHPLVMAAMTGGQGAEYSLSNLASTYTDADNPTQTYGVDVTFRTAGDVDVLRDIDVDLNDEEQYVYPGSFSSTTYVRCTYISGSHMTGGDAEDTWHQCNAQRNFLMRYTSSGGPDTIAGTFDFELSDDGGSTIVATKSGVVVTAGELS